MGLEDDDGVLTCTTAVPSCPVGQYLPVNYTTTDDCEECLAGTYSDVESSIAGTETCQSFLKFYGAFKMSFNLL